MWSSEMLHGAGKSFSASMCCEKWLEFICFHVTEHVCSSLTIMLFFLFCECSPASISFVFLSFLPVRTQSAFVLADKQTDNCCDVPLFCPPLLKLLASTKWWFGNPPAVSQVFSAGETGAGLSVVSVWMCVCAWDCLGAKVEEKRGRHANVSSLCYYSLRDHNGFSPLICHGSMGKRELFSVMLR